MVYKISQSTRKLIRISTFIKKKKKKKKKKEERKKLRLACRFHPLHHLGQNPKSN
jgi:hypothetical protein